MEKINANLHRMPKVTVLGIPALITPHKISRDTIHLGLFCYELKGNGNALEYPIIVAQQVPAWDSVGSIITIAPMLM